MKTKPHGVRRRINLELLFIFFSISRLGFGQAPDIGTIDGTWEGELSYLTGPGLGQRRPDAPPSVLKIRIVIDKNDVHVFNFLNGTTEEAKLGSLRLTRLLTNAVVASIDSGNDKDGTWVETWTFVLTLKDKGTLNAIWTRQVNNINLPLDVSYSKFARAASGELKRVK